ncbi:hypothetical protein F4811DRAFT_309499 [Daldinia bambusicola]|nr:hypothetical protein F4811DRAFT_309499 [Daldinia bambusicola]
MMSSGPTWVLILLLGSTTFRLFKNTPWLVRGPSFMVHGYSSLSNYENHPRLQIYVDFHPNFELFANDCFC